MKKFRFLLAITAIIFAFYLYSTQILRYSVSVNETFISSDTIPDTFDGVRIIQFSDLLIENQRDLKLLKHAVDAINRLNPDIVVFTGNLFKEGSFNSSLSSEVESLLSYIEATLVKVAVLGQEDISQTDAITKLLADSSFKILRNDSLKLFNGSPDSITLIGIDPLTTNPDLNSLLSIHSNSGDFNILLLHEPTLASTTTDFPIEVQLSGYCRGVNLSLDNLNSSYCNQFDQGIYKFANQLLLNVNTGLNRPNHLTTLLNRPTIDSFLLISE